VTSRRLLALALLVAMLAISVGACGIPADESPRAINEDALPAELNPNASTSTTLPPGPRERHDFFYVTGDEEPNTARLVVESREVPASSNDEERIDTVLRALLPRPEGTEVGTRIPQQLDLLGVDLNDETDTLTLTWSAELGDIGDEGLQLAVAQIVFTATQFDEVDSVQFKIRAENGDISTGVPDQNGDARDLVSRADYNSYAP
jgi:spore germination protein GerM